MSNFIILAFGDAKIVQIADATASLATLPSNQGDRGGQGGVQVLRRKRDPDAGRLPGHPADRQADGDERQVPGHGTPILESQEAGLKLQDAIDAKNILKIAIEERWG